MRKSIGLWFAVLASCSSSEDPGAPELSETRIDFGQADCGGAAPASKSVTLTNSGPGELEYGATVTGDGFALEGASGGKLAEGDSTTLTVSAAAVSTTETAGRNFTGVLVVTSGPFNAPAFSVPISMQAAGAVLQITPGLADFGVFPTGTQAPDIPITVTNTGNKSATVTFSTPSNTDFTLDSASSTIDAGATKVATTARFHPLSTTLQQSLSTMTVTGGVCAGSTTTLQLKGQGSKGVIGVSPGTLDYGLTNCGATNTPMTFTIANSGNAAVTFTATLAGGSTSPYSLSSPGGLLLPSTQTSITVSPKQMPTTSSTADNSKGDTLTITTDVPGDTPKTVDLRQTARGAVLSFASSTLTFPTTVAGLASPPSVGLNIVNSGNAAASVTGVFTGASQTEQSFRFPTTPTPIPVGTNPVPLTFDPLGLGNSTTDVLISTTDVTCAPLPTTPVSVTGDSTTIVAATQASIGGGNQRNPQDPSQCVRLSSGRVACWGNNGNGQLGIGAFGGQPRVSPQIVRNLSGITMVASTGGSNFALTAGGRVFAWGRNERGQLGDGTNTNSNLPVDIGITNVKAIDADHLQACALTNANTVLCWGFRTPNRGGAALSTPTLVMPAPAGAVTYKSIAVAAATVCALRSDGAIDCQGGNSHGQLGIGSTSQFSSVVTRVNNITTATQLDGGAGGGRGGWFCAVLSNGTVQCWGNLSHSKNGGANTSGNSTVNPVAITGLTGITQVSVGSQHACALQQATGPVFCWGMNSVAQTGATAGQAQTAFQVTGLSSPIQVIAGGRRSCAFATGGYFCWGEGIGTTPQAQPGF